MTTTEVRIVKTYRGKGAGRITVWAVRRYVTAEIFETLGVWATEAEAVAYTNGARHEHRTVVRVGLSA